MKKEHLSFKRIQIFPGEPAARKKVYVFMVCFFISSIFWLIIKLSQEGQSSYSQPVAVEDIPQGMFLESKSHSYIRYSVRTTGARILTSRFFVPTDTFRINASGLPTMVRDEQTVHYITYSSIAFRVANQLRTDVELVNVWPDTLFLQLVPAMEKKVNVVVRADIEFASRFNQYGPMVVEPDSVTIVGPQELVDTLTSINTRYFSVEELNSTRRLQVELQRPSGLADAVLSDETVQVEIPVEEFTEASINVPLGVRCDNGQTSVAPDDLVLYPSEVDITYMVALKDYGRVDSSSFAAYVSCPELEKLPERLEVIAERHPPYVIFQNVKPRSVEYLIVK